MHHTLRRYKSKALFTIVNGVILINPAFAQDAASQPATPPSQQAPASQNSEEASTLDTIYVTGVRNSLTDAMNTKRDAVGVVDAISAEDIGKFPDTNLAESLQRITGISIERRDGEGAQITARGFGPEFNLITLNGRQVPGADGFGNGDPVTGGTGAGTRAFNFAQLASEAIDGIEVYKTGRANVASGGIGATVDIRTARPLDREGLVANLGAKAVSDQSEPFDSSITPELSGILSWSNDDRNFGVGLTASYQERNGGSAQSTVNAWNIQRWTGTEAALRPDAVVVNAPAIGQLYGIPNDIRYAFSDFERERINGQAVVQFAPTDALTLTLDYTYANNQITEVRGEQTTWLQRGNSFTNLEFDTGQAVATPVYLREIAGGGKDFGFEQQTSAQEYKLNSVGFNAEWNISDRFSLNFDAHNTKSRSLPNDSSSGGSLTAFSLAGTAPDRLNNNYTQEFRFNTGLPISTRTLFPTTADAVANTNGRINPNFSGSELGSQILRIFYTRQETEIKEGRIDGTFDFDDGRFQFGVNSSQVSAIRQTSDSYNVLGDWGVGNAGNEPGMVALLRPISITGVFDDFNTNGAAPGAWTGDANALAQWGAAEYGASPFFNPQLNNDNLIEEDTFAAYAQLVLQGELGGMATSTVVGLRFEETEVTSTSQILIPSALEWQANNDFRLVRSDQRQPFSESTRYNYLLPSLDFSIDFTDSLKGRASFSQTIARAPYGNLYAGPEPGTPTGSILVNPSTRAAGGAQNPTLQPLESNNVDVALEWYFAESSFISVTLWDKRVDNFVGNSVVRETLYDLRDPTSGPDAQQALAFLLSPQCATQVTAAGGDLAAGCSSNDTALFTALALLRNAAATGGLAAYNGTNQQVLDIEALYNLIGEADDPLYEFDVNRPINQNAAHLKGIELGGQYFFGPSGFGIQANYTFVDGDIGYDNAGDPGIDQFALTGLSDTANAVFIYENFDWTVRLAWNWRDEYLIAGNQQGSNRNPYYVEAYDQIDLSIGYTFTDNLSVGFETINLTGEDVRWQGRSDKQLIKLIDQSPRYNLGVRYKF